MTENVCGTADLRTLFEALGVESLSEFERRQQGGRLRFSHTGNSCELQAAASRKTGESPAVAENPKRSLVCARSRCARTQDQGKQLGFGECLGAMGVEALTR